MIGAEIVSDLVPEDAQQIALGLEVVTLIGRDCRFPGRAHVGEERGLRDDVVPDEDRAPVLAHVLGIVREDRRGVGATRLAEIGDDVVHADRNVFADSLLAVIGQRVLEALETGRRARELALRPASRSSLRSSRRRSSPRTACRHRSRSCRSAR